jgi:Protein of unknown function (DUF3667)
MGEFEAIGDAVTGGMIGRAVEPRAGEGAEGHTHEAACLNCGTQLSGPYCHECGQHAHVHRTLSAFFHDFAHGVLHFEGKIWRTLPLLAWKPGALTRRYIEGQRARFVSPIALYLFSVFLMFGVLSATGNVNPHLGNTSRDITVQQQDAEQRIAKLQQKRAKLVASREATVEVDDQLGEAQGKLELIKMMRQRGITSAMLDSDNDIHTDVPFLKQAFVKAKENPELLLYKLKSDSYKWSWAIIPLSVPFVWLLFPFSRRFRLYDHTVFVTYSVSFMTLLVTVGTLIAAAGATAIAPFMLFIPPIHMYRQLRGAYGVGRWGALWRTSMLLLVAVIVLCAFILLMVTLGVLD